MLCDGDEADMVGRWSGREEERAGVEVEVTCESWVGRATEAAECQSRAQAAREQQGQVLGREAELGDGWTCALDID
jgi:hypothetical protein